MCKPNGSQPQSSLPEHVMWSNSREKTISSPVTVHKAFLLTLSGQLGSLADSWSHTSDQTRLWAGWLRWDMGEESTTVSPIGSLLTYHITKETFPDQSV